MNLRQLRAFTTIVDSGGFARAADRLHLTQPALSRQIRALESDLGVFLFDRTGRRVQLTSEGEDLLARSRHLLAEAAGLLERAHSLKSGDTGILRVGATPQVIENLLAKFLTPYRQLHPGVEVHLVEDGGTRLHERLVRGDVHLAMTAAGGTRFEDRLLYPMHLLAVVSPEHAVARRTVIDICDLSNEPLLVLRPGFGSREWLDIACELAGIRPRVLLDSGAPGTLVALAAANYAIAILPSNAQVPRDAVRAVPLVHRGASIGRWAHIAWDPQRFLAPYAECFVTELAAFCRRDFPGRDLIKQAPRLPKPAGAS
jgi:DNA-binding transcriptional LysR family regulator